MPNNNQPDLERSRMKFWLLSQQYLLDEIGTGNWDWFERKAAAYFHDRLFRTGWPQGSDVRRERNRLMLAYNEAVAKPLVDEL